MMYDFGSPHRRSGTMSDQILSESAYAAGIDAPIDGRQTANATNDEYAMTDFRLLINGRLVEGAGTLDVINPATGRVLTVAPRPDRAQLDEAGAAAKTAFPTWSATPLRQRAALLVKLAEALEAEQGRFARLVTEEQGKPLPQAMWEIAVSIAILRYFATLDLPPEVLK